MVKGGSLFGQVDRNIVWLDKLKGLRDDEKTVYKMMVDAGGTMFQSEIVEKIGWSKVKVTRTLDKLESRRLLERRRRGLTNIVVLKDSFGLPLFNILFSIFPVTTLFKYRGNNMLPNLQR